MEIALSPETRAFVEEQVRSGRFSSADEVVNAALSEMLEADRHEAWLRQAVAEGEADIKAGRVIRCETEDDLKALFEDVKRRGRERFRELNRARSA